MEKPERLLYIYTRFLNGKALNKEELAQRLNVNVRSIQRDISDINNFLYEDQEWHGLEGQIVYDKTIEKHRLKIDRYKFKNNRLLNLIFRMKNFTPIIHEDTYNLIRGLNANSNLAEKLLSNKMLSQFNIHREFSESTLIFRIQLAIENNHKISIQLQETHVTGIIPIYTRYFADKYWFTYLTNGEVHTLDLSVVKEVEQLNDVYDQSVFEGINSVTMLIQDHIWPKIERQFIIVNTKLVDNGRIVDIIISKEESMHIAYEHPNQITLLKPQHYVDDFKVIIKSLFNSYNI
ncbi:HTH domain-containing protein [Staphylococcus xylosus]|uniref:HTH domain-containing protein n=1 Tax=Staphylococcus xylosus TaxID=1288 RepID=UPI002DB55C2A|nr:HTH domain-containing protein [Staphylococcus xylosus]MEB7800046.1 HTH domain-containing protein [Staphylococcus xylosus]